MSVSGKREREPQNYLPITHTFVPFVLCLLAILFIKHACIVMITVSGLKYVCRSEPECTFLCMLLRMKSGWMFHVADRQQG